MATPEPEEAVSLKNLVADCTCPVCQQLLVQPQRLRCQHTFCLRCYHKMCRKLKVRPSSPDALASRRSDSRVQCPVCRETFDCDEPVSEDLEAQMLLEALSEVKSQLCQEADCWRAPDVTCPCCQLARCHEHHRQRVDELMANCEKVSADVEAFINQDDCSQQLQRLQQYRGQLEELREQMEQRLALKMEQCCRDLAQSELRLREQRQQSQLSVGQLREDLTRLREAKEKQDLRQLNLLVAGLQSQLQRAKRGLPRLEVSPAYASEEFLSSFDALLAKVRMDTLVRPYEDLGPELRPCKVKPTRKLQPWDLCLLTNVSGVFVDSESLTLSRTKLCQPLEGPCLVVNFKGFVSKCLHVLNADGCELATIRLEMKAGEMPGKFHVCNRRQLIFASDPGHHEVFVHNLGGALVKRFGGHGRDDGKFDEPMSMFADEGFLYVADSENKRVQLFAIDEDYAYVTSLRHRSFTNHVHSVIVSGAYIAVSDRECKQIFTFDKATRQPLEALSLEGQPFDMVTDSVGNVLVTLTQERKLLVLDASVSRCLNSFKISRGTGGAQTVKDDSDSSSSSDEVLRMLSLKRRLPVIHGLAFAPELNRLFVCDTFRRAILIFDL